MILIIYIIDTATNTVTATNVISSNLEYSYQRIAFNHKGTKAYATTLLKCHGRSAEYDPGNVSVIDIATNTVTATVPTGYNGTENRGIAVTPDGTKVYVTQNIGTVSVIDTATNTVTDTVKLGYDCGPISVTPDGTKVYVESDNNFYVIDIATNTVTDTVKGFSGDGYDIVIGSPLIVPNAEITSKEQLQPATTEKPKPTTMEQTQTTITEQLQYTPTEQTQDTLKGQPETSSASINLHGEKTKFLKGEEILFKLSAVNLITKPTMHVQVIIIPPSGMSVSSSEFVESGAGQYTTTYDLEPGKGKDIEVRIVANQVGNFNVNGRVVYYFGKNKQDAEDYTFNLPIQVKEVLDASEVQPIPEPTPETHNAMSGFGVESIIPILLVAFLLRRN